MEHICQPLGHRPRWATCPAFDQANRLRRTTYVFGKRFLGQILGGSQLLYPLLQRSWFVHGSALLLDRLHSCP
jgi:hypothetical protein